MPLTQHEQDQIRFWIREELDADFAESRQEFEAWKAEWKAEAGSLLAGIDGFVVRIARLITEGKKL